MFLRIGSGLGEEFVFLAGGFDLGFPLLGGLAFELHEVGHVVARVREGGEGFFLERGRGVRVFIELDHEAGEVFAAETLTRVLTREAEARQQAAVVSIEQDPLVLQLCQRVDGKVDPGSVRPLEQPQEAAATSAPSDHARHPELA